MKSNFESSSVSKNKGAINFIFLVVIFISAALIRLYDITDLPLDFHPGRQLQSMIKARGMYYQNNLYAPPWQRELAVKQWRNSPIQEPEINEWSASRLYKLFGHEDINYARILSIIYWLAGGVGLFLLAKDLINLRGAFFAIIFFLFLPYSIKASRTFMPDPLMVMFMIWGWWACWRWYRSPNIKSALLAGVLCGLAVLVKLTSIFMVVGAVIGLVVVDRSIGRKIRNFQWWLIGGLAILPGFTYNILGIFVLKFIWSGDTSNRLLFGALLEPLYYLRWFYKLDEVVGFGVLILAIAGFFLLTKRSNWIFLSSLWAGYLLFGIFFFYYFATHDYYHLPLIPLVALCIAQIGILLTEQISQIWQKPFANIVWIGLTLLAVLQSMWQVRTDFKRIDYRPEAAFWQEIGETLRGHSVLALTQDYNSRLSYWGWFDADYFLASGDFSRREISGIDNDILAYFEEKIQGKDLFLITMLADLDNQPVLKQILSDYPIYQQAEGYQIYSLQNP